jgi:hypothetical protein
MISKELINQLNKNYCATKSVYLVSDKLWQRYRRSINSPLLVDEIEIRRKWFKVWQPKVRILKGFNNLTFRGIPVINKTNTNPESQAYLLRYIHHLQEMNNLAS